jgi:hypothetical protein
LTNLLAILLFCAPSLLLGCATDTGRGTTTQRAQELAELNATSRVKMFSREFTAKILTLDPSRVTEQEVRELLSKAPAPHIVCIHGGILPIKSGMNSFAQFLIGMGYPESSIRSPGNGSYTFGYYDSAEEIAGTVAWYYEQDGLRPMIFGHSQGGIQVIRVLHMLAGDSAERLRVWNPVTRTEEERYEIRNPVTGMASSVVGLKVSYASAAAAGGLARALPNEWDMNSKLRSIPDSVEEFTGFQKGLDPFGGDYLGFGPANDYHAISHAVVRNVRLPSSSSHWTIPYIKSLIEDDATRQWVQNYQPGDFDDEVFESKPETVRKNAHLVWAAESWYSIKKHWVLELQRLIRDLRESAHDP